MNTISNFLPSTGQPCLYQHTIGTSLPVVITQSAPVCLICSATTSTLWDIGGSSPSSIAATRYIILYVKSPATAFIGGPHIGCNSLRGDNLITSIGMYIIGDIQLLVIVFHSWHSSSSCTPGCNLCE